MEAERSGTRRWRVSFPESSFPPVSLPEGACLSEHLSVDNSPLLFGCRTGICGTCVIEIDAVLAGVVEDPSPAEREVLDLVAEGVPNARLACQIRLKADIAVKPLDWSSGD